MIKKLRYNLLMLGLVALICCYVGMTLFMASPSQNTDTQGSAGTDMNVSEEQNPQPEDPSMDVEPPKNVKIPTKAAKLLAYALDIYENGEGYQSNFSTTIQNTAAGVSVTQKVVGSVSRGVNSKGEKVSLEEDYYYAENVDPIAAGFVANYFRGFYENSTTGQTQVGITENYNRNNKTYVLPEKTTSSRSVNETKPTEDVLSQFKIMLGLGFPIDLQIGKNATISSDETDNDIRTLTIKITDLSSLSQNYLDYFASTGDMSNINYTKVTIKIKINKKNGYIKQIVRTDCFTSVAKGFKTTSESTITQTFSSMNKACVLKDSL